MSSSSSLRSLSSSSSALRRAASSSYSWRRSFSSSSPSRRAQLPPIEAPKYRQRCRRRWLERSQQRNNRSVRFHGRTIYLLLNECRSSLFLNLDVAENSGGGSEADGNGENEVNNETIDLLDFMEGSYSDLWQWRSNAQCISSIIYSLELDANPHLFFTLLKHSRASSDILAKSISQEHVALLKKEGAWPLQGTILPGRWNVVSPQLEKWVSAHLPTMAQWDMVRWYRRRQPCLRRAVTYYWRLFKLQGSCCVRLIDVRYCTKTAACYPIQRQNPSTGGRLLGVRMAPDGSFTNEFQYRLQQVREMAMKLAAAPFDTGDVLTVYQVHTNRRYISAYRLQHFPPSSATQSNANSTKQCFQN